MERFETPHGNICVDRALPICGARDVRLRFKALSLSSLSLLLSPLSPLSRSPLSLSPLSLSLSPPLLSLLALSPLSHGMQFNEKKTIINKQY